MDFQDFLRLDPANTDVAAGAIHAVAPLLGDPDPDPTTLRLDAWARELAARMPLPWNLHEAVDALHRYVFQELGFEGDRETYEDPDNLLLPKVIQRKQGIPITLSILWIALARRLGFEATGVALPGHFITALRTRIGFLHFDPFHGGRPVGEELAARIVHRATRGRVAWTPSMMEPVPDRVVLARLLRTLQARFLERQTWEDAHWTATHQIYLNPEDPRLYQERALIHLKRHDLPLALEDLRTAWRLLGDPSPELVAQIERLEQGRMPHGA